MRKEVIRRCLLDDIWPCMRTLKWKQHECAQLASAVDNQKITRAMDEVSKDPKVRALNFHGRKFGGRYLFTISSTQADSRKTIPVS